MSKRDTDKDGDVQAFGPTADGRVFTSSGVRLYPFVREAGSDQKQRPNLTPLNDPFTNDTTFVSPIYLLTKNQRNRNMRNNPYQVRGAHSIATKIQNECEEAGRVLYPLYVESDADRSPSQQIAWIDTFLRQVIGTDPESTNWYYSGGRSIHAHVPLFFKAQDDLKLMRSVVDTFNQENAVDLDCAIYSKKRQFRIPGVRHEKTKTPKVPIEPDWDDGEIAREVDKRFTSVSKPVTPADYFIETFGDPDFVQKALRGELRYSPTQGPKAVSGTPSQTTLDTRDKPVGLRNSWPQYSPFAYDKKDTIPSVAVVRVLNEPYEWDSNQYLEVEMLACVGCLDAYRVDPAHPGSHNRVIRLSKRDFKILVEMETSEGDRLVLIGQRCNWCKILEVDKYEAQAYASILAEMGRKDLLVHLSHSGEDVGTIQRKGYNTEINAPKEGQKTRRLKREVEKRGIQRLTHLERSNLANGLLRVRGWVAAGIYFRKQYGRDFDPKKTYEQFKSLSNSYEDLPAAPDFETWKTAVAV